MCYLKKTYKYKTPSNNQTNCGVIALEIKKFTDIEYFKI